MNGVYIAILGICIAIGIMISFYFIIGKRIQLMAEELDKHIHSRYNELLKHIRGNEESLEALWLMHMGGPSTDADKKS